MRLGKKSKRFSGLLLCCSLIACWLIAVQPSLAADAGAMGMALYNAKRYKEAMTSFRKAIVEKPRESSYYYYYALCQQRTGDLAGARKTYLSIIKSFPGSDAATSAGGALGVMDRTGAGLTPSATTQTEAQPSTGGTAAPARSGTRSTTPTNSAPGTAPKVNTTIEAPTVSGHAGFSGSGTVTGPDECNIHFEKVNNSIIVDAMVNYRPTKMIFDTGAEHCAFAKNHLQEMSLRAPTGPPTGKAGGVGAGGVQDTWDMPVTLTIGPITRKDFHISVQTEMMGQPLLGETFFQDFTYTIDNGGSNIHVRRKNKQQGSIYHQQNDPYAVPFTRMGNEIIVQGQVNGRPTQVIFDTGASVCAFTKEQVSALGISIPDDAQQGQTQGIAGMSATSIFPIKSIRVGPIEKRDFDIHVVSDAKMPAPLLGQTFYGDWQYTIDYENKLIHFLRR